MNKKPIKRQLIEKYFLNSLLLVAPPLRSRSTSFCSGRLTRDKRKIARLAIFPNFLRYAPKTSFIPDVVQNNKKFFSAFQAFNRGKISAPAESSAGNSAADEIFKKLIKKFMRKKIFILTTLLMSFFLLAGLSCQQKSTTPVQQPAPTIESPKTIENTKNIAIKNFAFSPAELTVKAGDTVIWTNEDSAPHSIKSKSFNSNILQTGDAYQFKFDNTGVYDYICGIHPSMKGKIIVE